MPNAASQPQSPQTRGAQIRQRAISSEADIASRAKEIRGDAKALTSELFMQLWPLLCEPIPEGFLKTVPKQTGKPYDSTGVSSVQVQIDRMNNVLSPLWWHDHVEYHDGGCVAHVEVHVRDGAGDAESLIVREAWGGVDRGSTKGNVYKGSYTNAAKLAFARLGPGHEVYLGATDLDPDVNEQAVQAEQPVRSAQARKITKAKAEDLWDAAKRAGVTGRLQLAASHILGSEAGDCSTRTDAVRALVRLNTAQAAKLADWIAKKAAEALDA